MTNKLQELYRIAERYGITILEFPLHNKKAFCVKDDDNKFIAIDFSKIDSEAEACEILAEEIAHLKYGLLYSVFDCIYAPAKARMIESLTKRKAIKLLAALQCAA